MILSDMRDYLKTHRRAAVYDLSVHFDVEPEAVRAMLAQWQRKGRVRKLPEGTACEGGCRQCDPAGVEIYEWCG